MRNGSNRLDTRKPAQSLGQGCENERRFFARPLYTAREADRRRRHTRWIESEWYPLQRDKALREQQGPHDHGDGDGKLGGRQPGLRAQVEREPFASLAGPQRIGHLESRQTDCRQHADRQTYAQAAQQRDCGHAEIHVDLRRAWQRQRIRGDEHIETRCRKRGTERSTDRRQQHAFHHELACERCA